MKRKLCRKLIALMAAFCVLTAGCGASGSSGVESAGSTGAGSQTGAAAAGSVAYAAEQSSAKTLTSIISVKQVKYESLKIKWKKVENVKKYQLYRADKATGTYKKIATVSGESYSDANIKQNKTYYYKVKPAADGAAQSAKKSGKIKTTVSLAKIPKQKEGSAYTEVNGGEPTFSSFEKKRRGFEEYAALDKLGRCGITYACIDRSMMPTEKRGSIGMIKPSGWHTIRYDDLISDKYLYNRCHLIGYQLTGQNANKRNLITGTRYLNVTGMLPFEDEVAEYVEKTGNHVLYRVTPIFKGNNLVCSGVQMEAQSLEDDEISFNIFAYNSQPGIVIDYKTGDSHASSVGTGGSGSSGSSSTSGNAGSASSGSSGSVAENAYVLNTNTMKFHFASCASVKRMSDKNKKLSGKMTRSQIMKAGYEPCGQCKP